MVITTDKLLFDAVRNGDLKGVKDALAKGALVNALESVGDAYSQTALIIATADGKSEIVKLLLESGANPNFQVTGEDWNGMSALMFAAMKGYIEITKLLLQYEALVTLVDENDAMAYDFAVKNNHKGIAKLLEKNSKDKNFLLLESADCGNLERVEKALKMGADVDAKYPEGDTPLLRVCNPTTPETEIAILLVKKGAKVDARGKSGVTPLMEVSIRGDDVLAKLFLKKGADADAKDKDGKTALMYAANGWRCWPDVIKILLKNSADPKLKDNKGKTAYDIANEKYLEQLKMVKSSSQGRIYEPYITGIKEIMSLLRDGENKK
jgi:hypothetical protein